MEKKYTVCGKEVSLKPLTIRESGNLIFEIGDENKRMNATLELIQKTFEKSGVPVLLDDIHIGEFAEYLEATLDVNGLKR